MQAFDARVLDLGRDHTGRKRNFIYFGGLYEKTMFQHPDYIGGGGFQKEVDGRVERGIVEISNSKP